MSVYKTPANATLTVSAGTKPQSSDLGWAVKDESSDWSWCSGARVWMMLSAACRRTGGGGKSVGDEDSEDGGGVKPRPSLGPTSFLFDTL